MLDDKIESLKLGSEKKLKRAEVLKRTLYKKFQLNYMYEFL